MSMLLSQPERNDRFVIAWEDHKKAGFAQTQDEVDRIAAMWGVEAPKLPTSYPVWTLPPGRGGGGRGGGRWGRGSIF